MSVFPEQNSLNLRPARCNIVCQINKVLMNELRVKVLLLRFQFICTKTIRRLDPLRVNIVNNNKGQQPPPHGSASKLHFPAENGQKSRKVDSSKEEQKR